MNGCILIYVCFATLLCVSSGVLAKPGVLAWFVEKPWPQDSGASRWKALGIAAMTFCPPNFPSVWFALPLIQTALSSKCWCESLAKDSDVEESLQALAGWFQRRCCRYLKKSMSNKNYCFCHPLEQEWTSAPSIAFSSPSPDCNNLTNRKDATASGTWSTPFRSYQPSPLVFLTCGCFMLCVVSSCSEWASGRNIHIFQNSEVQPVFAEVECPSHLLHLYLLQLHAQWVSLQTFLPWWCYRNERFSGCFGKASKIRCIYLASQSALQILSVWLYQKKEKQHGRVGNLALPSPCLL